MSRRSDRLRRIQRVREVQEEQARAEWLAAEDLARTAEARLESLRAARAQMTDALAAKLPDQPASWTLISHDAIDRVARRAAEQRDRARTARAQAEAAREPWTEKRAAARGLERLVERAAADERREDLAGEARDLDENTMARHRGTAEE